jgi:hypothetical protein
MIILRFRTRPRARIARRTEEQDIWKQHLSK